MALLTYRQAVTPEMVDYNNHLSDGYYVVIFSNATTAMMEHIGLGAADREATGHTIFTLEMHVNYLSEVKGGTTVRVDTQFLGYDAKRLHILHSMHRGDDADIAATNEQMLMNIELAGPKAAPFRPEAAKLIAGIALDHAKLPRHANIGRAIALPAKR